MLRLSDEDATRTRKRRVCNRTFYTEAASSESEYDDIKYLDRELLSLSRRETNSLLSAHRERGLSRRLGREIDEGKGGRSTPYNQGSVRDGGSRESNAPVTKRTSTIGPAQTTTKFGSFLRRLSRTEVFEDGAQHLGFHFGVQVRDVDGPASRARRYASRPRCHFALF